MKTYILKYGMVLLAAAGCTAENIEESHVGTPEGQTYMTLIGNTAVDTKLAIGDKDGDRYPLSWSAGDQLGQDHHLDVLVLQKDRMVRLIRAGIRYALYHRIGIHHPATPLINPLFQEHRIFLRLAYPIGRDHDFLFPNFYTLCHDIAL